MNRSFGSHQTNRLYLQGLPTCFWNVLSHITQKSLLPLLCTGLKYSLDLFMLLSLCVFDTDI